MTNSGMPELDFSKLPNRGWTLNEVVDLDDLVGVCQRCDTAIRCEHHCHHPMGVNAIVGCICCGLVSVPGTRLKRLNSLFKQQILNCDLC